VSASPSGKGKELIQNLIYGVRGAAFERNSIRNYDGTLGRIFNGTLGRAACEACSGTQHLLWDKGKRRKTLIELAGRRTFRMLTDF
jgi:hypothetical protein